MAKAIQVDTEIILKNLKHLREACNVSQADLADVLRTSPMQVYRIENIKSDVSLNQVVAYLNVLGYSLDIVTKDTNGFLSEQDTDVAGMST